MKTVTRRSFLSASLLVPAGWRLLVTTAPAAEQRGQPPAKEYIRILEDPHRIERLHPEEVVRALEVRAGHVVADIGAGSGLFTRPLARAVQPGGWVYAVDVDAELLSHVLRTAAEQGLANVTAVLGMENSPALPQGSVDLAFICDTLHHIGRREEYLANVRQAMKPGGRLAIIDFRDRWPSGHESMRFTLEDLDRWTAAAGFVKTGEHRFIENNFFHIYGIRK